MHFRAPIRVSFEKYTDAEYLHKTKFRRSLSHEQVELARVQTSIAIILPR
jgi:hypothetical protein